MPFQDKNLVCEECGQQFVFTAGEQEFYSRKGFSYGPKRCKPCRFFKKRNRGGEQYKYRAMRGYE